MQIVSQILMPATGLMTGLTIGYAFGLFQDMAARRNQQRLDKGVLHSGWSLMPGSMTRVAMLLIALALVQVGCPSALHPLQPVAGIGRGGGRLRCRFMETIAPPHGGSLPLTVVSVIT